MDNTVGSQQDTVIIGTLLGDGFLEFNGTYTRLVIDHSMKQKEYVSWLQSQLHPLPTSLIFRNRYDRRTGNTYGHCILRTKTSQYFEKYVKLFYPNGIRRIPTSLPLIINPRILAIWIMDDGYKRNDCNAMRINTQAYTYDEHIIMQKSLMKLSLDTTI